MYINLEWDAAAQAAPQSFKIAVQAAATILDTAIFDPIVVNIGIGYGEYANGSIQLDQGYSLGGVANGVAISYPLLKAALIANASSATVAQALAQLPSTTSLNGQTTFALARAQAKALGALPATDPGIDGYAGFPTNFTGSTATGAAIVELVHAMGLLNGPYPLSLFEYTSPGQHLLTDGTSSTPAYFSLDNGTTNLGNYDVGFDSTLFSNPANDALSAPISGNVVLSALDRSELGAIGFNTTAVRPTATPSITPSITAAGTRPTLTLQNVTISANTSIPVASLIRAVTVPSGESISSYGFFDTGTAGHLAIDGAVEPGGQWVQALDTQLGALVYVAGSAPGTDVIDVYAVDDTTGTNTSVGLVTVTIVAAASGGPNSASGAPGVAATVTNNVTSPVTNTVTNAGINTVQLGAGPAIVTSTGTDTILGSSGSATITTSGNARIVGGSGALTVQGGAGNDVVYAGSGGLTFTGGTGFDTVLANGNAATITAGTGGGLFQGGGNATITAGAGGAQNVVFGSNGDQMLGVGSAGVLFGNSGGDPARSTLMSSAGDTGNSYFFGATGTGQMTFITGAGNDLLAVGQGTNTVQLGSGTATVFANLPGAGATTVYAGSGNASLVMGGAATDLVITAVAGRTARLLSIYNDAASTDKLSLVGYGANQIASTLANQVSSGGGTLLTLGDGTTLALVGVQHATASLFA